MNGPPSHDRLHHRYSLRGAVVFDGAVHVGTGEMGGVLSATDMPVARDGQGLPYLPGSSLRGALRAGVESLLRGLSRSELRVCDPFDTGEKSQDRSCSERIKDARAERADFKEDEAFTLAWDNSCEVCKLFGSSFLASRVRIADLPLASELDEAPIYVRDGVGLDRDLRTASRRILYSFEAVSVGARFDLKIDFENAEPYEMGLLLVGLDLFKDGLAAVGGKRSRGLGAAGVEDLVVVRKAAEDFFTGSAGVELGLQELADFRQAARAHYLEGN